jgi:hypothetical protein
MKRTQPPEFLLKMASTRSGDAAEDRATYEHNVVSRILARYRLQRVLRDAGPEIREMSSDGRLTLAQFQAAFPAFPVWLATTRIKRLDQEFTIRKIFTKFSERTFVTAYLRLESAARGVDRPLAIIFPCYGLDEIGCCVHNYDVVETIGARLVGYWPEQQLRLTFEPLQQLLRAIDERVDPKIWSSLD